MNKKNNFLYLVIFIILIVIVGYCYFNKESLFGPANNQSESESDSGSGEIQQLPDEQSGTPINTVTDGIFQKIENNVLYFIPKDSDSPEQIDLDSQVFPSESILSAEYELEEEKVIGLSDFKDGDNISVTISYYQGKPDEKTATIIKRITIR